MILSSVLLFFFGIFDVSAHYNRPVIIAVLDSGLDTSSYKANLCKYGHKDFTKYNFSIKEPVPKDNAGHGTQVTSLIERELKYVNKKDYCVVVVKFFDTYDSSPHINAINMIKALKYLANIKPDIINISGGGEYPYHEEEKYILQILNNGTKIVAAAGNNGRELNKTFSFYPAMYHSDIIVVGGLDENGNIHKTSNRGSVVDVYELGVVYLDRVYPLIGSSYATAIHTGKLARKIIENKNYGRNNNSSDSRSIGRTDVRWIYQNKDISNEIKW